MKMLRIPGDPRDLDIFIKYTCDLMTYCRQMLYEYLCHFGRNHLANLHYAVLMYTSSAC